MISHPIMAVTHPDPYPYYDELATRRLAWDDGLGMWIAARVVDVLAVLSHPAARVRPSDAAVPAALAGTAAGDTFGRLVRMTDRAERFVVKEAIAQALADVDDDAIGVAAARTAEHLGSMFDAGGGFVDRWITDFPIGVVCLLVGVDPSDIAVAIAAARDIAACFGPVPPTEARPIAERATTVLAGLARGGPLLEILPASFAEDAIANTVGLLFQTVDAMAGLVGNTVARLIRDSGTSGRVIGDIVAEVAVADPSVHNTRRFFAARADVGGVTIGAGDTVLVVLAAANHDPAGGAPLPFGAAGHRCPAHAAAPRIAAQAVDGLLDLWPDVLASVAVAGFRPLPNVRIPTFAP